MLISNCNRNSIRKSLQSKEPPKAVGKILFSTSALQASRDNSTMALLVCLQQCLQTVIYREQRVQRSELWSHPTCSWYSAVFRQELSFQTGEYWGPAHQQFQYNEDMGLLEQLWWRTTNAIKELGHLSYKERLKDLRWVHLEKRRLRRIWSMCINTWWEGIKKMQPEYS